MMDNSIICCLVKSGGLFVDIVYTIFSGDIKNRGIWQPMQRWRHILENMRMLYKTQSTDADWWNIYIMDCRTLKYKTNFVG